LARVPFDLAMGALLHKSRRLGLFPRLVLDAYDTATASLTEGHSYTAAARLGLPLSTEAGVRIGPAGLVVPAGHLLALAFLRRRSGLALRPATLGWHVLAVGAGVAFTAYERATQAAGLARHHREVAAKGQRARLAGQNDMAMGADSAIDLLVRTSLVVETQAGTSTAIQAMLSTWKAMLASDTEEKATYLGTALLRWQRRHNDQPALARDVELKLGEGEGTILISPRQVESLKGAMDAMDLRGEVKIWVLDRDQAHLPGASLRLMVAGREVTVPPDREAKVFSVDLGPAALWLAALLSALPAVPSQGAARWRPLVAAVTCFLGAGSWAQYQVARHGKAARQRIFLVGSAASLFQAVVTTPALDEPLDPEGLHRQVYLFSLFAQGALAALYRKDLSRPTRTAGALLALGSISAGTLLARLSLAEALWALGSWAPILASLRGLATALEQAEVAFAHDLQMAQDVAVGEAFLGGRADVLELIESTHRSLRQIIAAHPDSLSHADRAEIDRRLEEISERLAVAKSVPRSYPLSVKG
jgi:hypothetical protein